MASFRIGETVADFEARTIERDGDVATLEPKVMAVLLMLSERPGEVVSREELVDAIWDVRYGGDERLSRAISLLRKSLGDSGGEQGSIRTVPKHGYCLVAKVVALNDKDGREDDPVMNRGLFVPAPPNSIAVLPFDDMSESGDKRYLGDGISEEIINALAQIEGLQVTGRMSSFAVRDAGLNARQLGDTLGVSYVMEGSVRLSGDTLRITAQLISTEDGFHRWSREFDGDPRELFSFFESVSTKVGEALAELMGLEPPIRNRETSFSKSDHETYQLFLRGRSATHQQDGERSLPQAIELLSEVVDRDPEFAEAWAFLAIAHFFMLEYAYTPDWREHVAEGRKAAERAYRIAPGALITMVPRMFVASHDTRFDRYSEYVAGLHSRARSTNLARYYLAAALIGSGLMREGLEHLEHVLASEPLSIAGHSLLGTARFVLGEIDQSEEPYLRAFDLGFLPSGITAIWLLAERGKIAEAASLLSGRYSDLSPLFSNVFGDWGKRWLLVHAVVHQSEWARSILARTMRRRLSKGAIQPNAGSLIMPVILGRPKLFMDTCRAISATYLPGTLAQIWTNTINARKVREHDDFPDFARDVGLVAVWNQRGWPDCIDRERFEN